MLRKLRFPIQTPVEMRRRLSSTARRKFLPSSVAEVVILLVDGAGSLTPSATRGPGFPPQSTSAHRRKFLSSSLSRESSGRRRILTNSATHELPPQSTRLSKLRKFFALSFTMSLVLLNVCGFVSHGNAQMDTTDGRHITDWLVLGPFSSPNDLKDIVLAPGEDSPLNPRPQAGDTLTTASSLSRTWKRYLSKTAIVDLRSAFGHYEKTTAYAFCVLESQIAGSVEIRFGHYGGTSVWMNGKRVYHDPQIHGDSRNEAIFEVDLQAGPNPCLVMVAQSSAGTWEFDMRVLPPNRAVISGVVTDEKNTPLANAVVRLEQDGLEITQTTTDKEGQYRLSVYPAAGIYALSATHGELGGWRLSVPLSEGSRRTVDLTLKPSISIVGKLVMFDDKTPHVAVPVQVVSPGGSTPVATTLSDADGNYRFINLKPGAYQVRCQVPERYIYYPSENREIDTPGEILQVTPEITLTGIDFRFASFKKGVWRRYNALNGLAHNWVYAIHRSTDSNLWFGMAGGVSRYDSNRFVNFTTKDGLLHNNVWAICQSPDGQIWFGTTAGVSQYDISKGSFSHIKDGLADQYIQAIYCAPDGITWVGTRNGLFQYEGETLKRLTIKDGLAGNHLLAIYPTADGNLWFGTHGGGVSRYDGKGFTNFTTKEGLPDNRVYCIHQTPDGVLWFGTWGGGVSRYDEGPGFTNFTTKDGLVGNTVTSIHHDTDGTIWFGTHMSGISRYDGKAFVNFTTTDGLASNEISAINRDASGSMWFATRNGISQYVRSTFVSFTIKDGLANSHVWAMEHDRNGTMWFATLGGGVYRHDGNGFQNFTTQDGLASNIVWSIHADTEGMVWFGTASGVSRYNGQMFDSFADEVDGLAGKRVSSIRQDDDGRVWFGTKAGVFRYNGQNVEQLRLPDQQTPQDSDLSNYILTIHQTTDKTIWLGTKHGIFRYDGTRFEPFPTDARFVSGVYTILGDKADGLCFGTESGIFQYHGKEFSRFFKDDDSSHKAVRTIHRDSRGVLWFGGWGGYAGLSGYDGTAWTSLDIRDGLAGNDVYSIHRNADGALWLGTEKGVSRYRPSTTPPGVVIDSVSTDQLYILPQNIPPVTVGTRVSIKYHAIDFKTIPEKRQYRLQIVSNKGDVELDEQITSANNFDWTFKKGGRYTVEVKAIDRDLNYSDPAQFRLEVVPPWYLRERTAIPIFGGIFALFAAAVGFGWRYFVQRRQFQEQEARQKIELEESHRKLMAANTELKDTGVQLQKSIQELTRLSNFKSNLLSTVSHELRTPLTSIDGFIRLIYERSLTDTVIAKCNEATRLTVQRAKDELGIVYEETKRLSRLINDFLDFSRIERGKELELNLAPVNLLEVIESVIEMYQLRASEHGLRLEYGGNLPLHNERLMVYGDRDRLTQMLNNLVGNAIKFTPEGGEILINAQKIPGHIQVSVQDTGTGIPESKLETIFEPFEQSNTTDLKREGIGLGLAIVKNIIDRHRGTIRVESEEGQGSTFTITLPEYLLS